MKKLLLILFLVFFSVSCESSNQPRSCKENLYWENLSNVQKKAVLDSSEIDKYALSYYKGCFKPSDDSLTLNLLEELTNGRISCHAKAFYFHLFNQICMKADGALSEMLGVYCQRLMLSNSVYVLGYFQRNTNVEQIYANLIGYELYFKEEGTSTIKYNYADFKRILSKGIGEDKVYEKILNDFFHLINVAMKNMD